MNMYTHTQDRIDQIIARNLENVAETTPALIGWDVSSIGEHEHIVQFTYSESIVYNQIPQVKITHKTFDGRKWS